LHASLFVLAGAPAAGWDYFGHHVVAAIAWDHMDAETRAAAVSLLEKAPPDADLATLLPPRGRPDAVRQRELFLKASGWADFVRDDAFERRKQRYDKPSWHYVNHFWTPSVDGHGHGPRLLPERGTLGELITTMESVRRSVSDPSRSEAERAVDLAWILHLVGDVHQPLHSSARVTESEPDGDRGGNDFVLDERLRNLHAYWDGILRRVERQRHSESYFAWVDRVAKEIQELHPRSSCAEELKETDFMEWSRQGASLARNEAYPRTLVRGVEPSRAYRDHVFAIAQRRVAVSGYRLAALVESALR
jgi:hypothetical protein